MCLAPRVFDRRRALALVEAVDAPRGTCLVTWVHPRQKREIVCRYWKEVWHGNGSVIVCELPLSVEDVENAQYAS